MLNLKLLKCHYSTEKQDKNKTKQNLGGDNHNLRQTRFNLNVLKKTMSELNNVESVKNIQKTNKELTSDT